ncbi:unnamed protein product [Urochloa humidicola]
MDAFAHALACNCSVPKVNEVLYSWSSLLIGSDPSSTADIMAATRDFNEECLIGEGFTGRVYRDPQHWSVQSVGG